MQTTATPYKTDFKRGLRPLIARTVAEVLNDPDFGLELSGKAKKRLSQARASLKSAEEFSPALWGQRVVALQNIDSDELQLKQPLYVSVEQDEDGTVIISSMDLGIFGYGDTEYEAKQDFVRAIEDLYFNLKDEQDNLHKSALGHWEFMKKIIQGK